MIEPLSQRCSLPDLASFPKTRYRYLDAGSQHPLSRGASEAVRRYLSMRMNQPEEQSFAPTRAAVLAQFARLVNVSADELSFIQSTVAGEHMVVQALGMPHCGGHVITDHLHFFGSMPIYQGLQARGMDVTWLPARHGRIDLEDLAAAIRPDTRLVATSLVSTYNGFQHDLKALCDLAHLAGVPVYADIIHAAGCVPLDLAAAGVDFAATSSFKWLMGDFGAGFLYVSKSAWSLLQREQYGYGGTSRLQTHVYPLDPAGDTVADYEFSDDVAGLFSLGTVAHSVIAQLQHSLDYIQNLGVARIQAHAQSLIDVLKQELPALGFPLLTPPESRTPMVTVLAPEAAQRIKPHLDAHRLRISVAANHFRVSVSVFNTMEDIECLLGLLATQAQGATKRRMS